MVAAKAAAKEAMAVADAPLLVLEGLKYLLSTVLTFSAIAFICYGIGAGKAVLPGPAVLHYVVLVFVLVLLAYLEGLQVAILALESVDGGAWQETHPRGYRLHKLVTQGRNVQRFLVGRQFYVVFVVFLCSQVTTFPAVECPEVFPEVLWFILVETALPGALLVLAFGQLMPQLIASQYPVMFCNLRGSMLVLHMTLVLESFGITHFSWLLTAIVTALCGLGRSGSGTAAGSGEEVEEASPRSPAAAVLERLVTIQQNWKRTPQGGGKLEFVDIALPSSESAGGGAASDKLFITSAMAQDALQHEWEKRWEKPTPQANLYPTPAQIAAHLAANGQEVPRFLLPPGHSLHVPPHILAYSLMSSMAAEGIRWQEVDLDV